MKLFTPGPVEVPREVLEAAARSVVHHRGEEFHRLFENVVEKLIRFLDLDGYVALVLGSGTTAVDAAIWSTIRRGEKALVLVHGEFGKRAYETALRRGALVDVLQAEPGDVVPVERVLEALDRESYDAIIVVHNETSTGTLYSYLEQLAKASRSRNTKLIVDAVSSFAGEELSMRWGIDVVATTSHKALASIPGVGIVAVSSSVVPEIKKCSKDVPLSLDLRRYIEFSYRRETPFTPAINALYTLEAALNRIERIGFQKYIAAHRERAEVLYRELQLLGFKPIPKKYELASHTVIAMESPIDAARIKEELQKRGYVIALGIGEMKRNVVRLGTMGNLTIEDTWNLLYTMRSIISMLDTDT